MNINEKFDILKKRYQMDIPMEYEEFISAVDFFDYAGTSISSNGIEFELNHFLKVDEEFPSRDVQRWYAYAEDCRKDYLTIAMGYFGIEIAIKVKGDDLGGIYYIDQTEEVIIKKLFDNFDDFKKQLI